MIFIRFYMRACLFLGGILFILLFSTPLSAQESNELTEDALIAETTDLQSTFFASATVGWIVGNVNGNDGTIFNTDDGGNSWEIQKNIKFQLQNIQCATTMVCLAVGDRGVALRTTDGGETWESLQTGIQSDLRDGYIFDSGKKIILVGERGVIRRSVDGGVTWKTIISGKKKTLTSIHFVNQKTAWITGEGGLLLKSTNGGSTWKSQKSGTNQTLFDMYSVTAKNLFIVGSEGVVRKTTNSGSAWSQQNANSNTELRSVFFIDRDQGIVVGSKGTLRVTADGGSSWETLDTDMDTTLRDVFCAAQNYCVIVGDKGTILLYDISAGTFITEEAGEDEEESTLPPQEEQTPEQQEESQSQQFLPDLIVTDAVFLSGATASFKVKNIGSASSPQTFRVQLQWLMEYENSPITVAPPVSFTLTASQQQVMLASQESILFQYPIPSGATVSTEQRAAFSTFFSTIPPNTAYKARITVDSASGIGESDETNNMFDLVRPTADLSLENLSFNTAYQSAEATLKNAGPRADGGQQWQVGVLFEWLGNTGSVVGTPFVKRVTTIIGTANPTVRLSQPVGTIPASAVKLRATPLFGDHFLIDPNTANDMVEMPRPHPDLIVTNAAFFPERVASFKVKNIGSASSPQTFRVQLQWLMEYESSPITVAPPVSFTLTASQQQVMLASQESILFQYPIPSGATVSDEQRVAFSTFFSTIPPNTAYKARITVDSSNSITESDDANNTFDLIRPTADLSLENLRFNSTGQSIYVMLRNAGPRSVGGQTWKTGVAFDWITGTGNTVGEQFTSRPTSDIYSGGGITITKSAVTIPPSAVKLRAKPILGDHFLIDPNLGNDELVIDRPHPDLIVTDAAFFPERVASFKVKNIGTASSPQTFRVQLQWLMEYENSPITVAPPVSFTLTASQQQVMLASQESILFQYPIPNGATVSDEQRAAFSTFFSTVTPSIAYTARITVDSSNSITESDDANNTFDLIRPTADLSLENLRFNSTGQSIYVTLRNAGPRSVGGQTWKTGVAFDWITRNGNTVGEQFTSRPTSVIPAGGSITIIKSAGTIPPSAVKLRATPLLGDHFLIDPNTGNDALTIDRP